MYRPTLSYNIIPHFLPPLDLEFLSKRGNEGHTEVADRLREFTWNSGTLEKDMERKFHRSYFAHSLALALHFTL